MSYDMAECLMALPTISQGHTCNLKIDDGERRVWVSRCEAPIVTIERLIDGCWVTVEIDGVAQ